MQHENAYSEWCWYLPDSGELMGDHHGRRRLEPVVAQVLDALLQRAGQVVSRRSLFDQVWRDRVVIDAALTRCISIIRSSLGDRPPHRYLETLPKRGYRFIGKVETCSCTSTGFAAVTGGPIDPTVAPCLTLIPGLSTRSSPSGVIR